MTGSSCADGQFGVVSVMSTVDRAVVRDVDLVDQAELVDVGRNFRVVDGLQRGDDVVGQAAELLGRDRAVRRRLDARSALARIGLGLVRSCEHILRLDQGLRQACRPRPWYCRARTTRGRSRSRRSAPAAAWRNGCRRAPRRPARSMMVATSCGCAPFISNETIAPLSLARADDAQRVDLAQPLVRIVDERRPRARGCAPCRPN